MINIKCAVHQFNPTVGALKENATKLIAAIMEAKNQGCNLFISSELSLCGYIPKDLLFRPQFHQQISKQLGRFLELCDITIIIGAPYIEGNHCHNSVYVIRDGKIIGRYDKQKLPNYGVFDENRYFTPGTTPFVFEHEGLKLGIIICEDTWHTEPAMLYKQAGAEVLISINASPFNIGKYQERVEDVAAKRVKETGLPLIYVNQLGGQDNLVFDGASFVLDEKANLVAQFPAFKQELNFLSLEAYTLVCERGNLNCHREKPVGLECHREEPVGLECHREKPVGFRGDLTPYPNDVASVYEALVLATHDYVTKNSFKGVLLGLSGGVDSALTLAIACDALGYDNVMAVMMPSRYTADISLTDSRDMVKRLNVKYEEIAIENIFNQFKSELNLDPREGPGDDKEYHSRVDGNPATDTTEENLQARIRGTLLMALSNKFGYLVLTTGNKSEMAVGYATLYGDMAGGFAVLKDVPKTLVYQLCKWRNAKSDIIPQRIITRAPSAELRENQTDQDSLPDYDTLDAIIDLIVEHKLSTSEIIERGFSEVDVSKVARLIKLNEYKRSQAAVGPKVTSCAFNNDWRYPITNHFNF